MAEFRGSPEPEPFSQADGKAGLVHIAESLGEQERARFLAFLGEPRAASDADVCWATVQLYRGASVMPEAQAVRYLRALVAAAAQQVATTP